MKDLQISVDPHGQATLTQTVQISEHCASRARLLSSLVNLLAAPGGFEHFGAHSDSMRREILSLMRSVAEEQLPLIAALEEHAAKSGYERGAQAARSVPVREEPEAVPVLHYDAKNQNAHVLTTH